MREHLLNCELYGISVILPHEVDPTGSLPRRLLEAILRLAHPFEQPLPGHGIDAAARHERAGLRSRRPVATELQGAKSVKSRTR